MLAPILALTFASLLQLSCINAQQPRLGDNWQWGYANQNEWDDHFAACNGNRQSPINIDTTKVVIDPRMSILFYRYNYGYYNAIAENNGHTVRVHLQQNQKDPIPYVTGEALNNKKFILDSFHFHWGLNEFNGSEHSLNNVKRSAELHLVHWNEKYGNMSNARDREDGLVVVTVFIEAKLIREYFLYYGPVYETVPVMAHNFALMPIINVLYKIRHFEDSTPIRDPITLGELLPINTNFFFQYQGSLTTPPCSPTATFIIFSNPIYMSQKQLSEFRQIEGEETNGVVSPLTHNTRQQMPLNNRVVKVSRGSYLNTKIFR